MKKMQKTQSMFQKMSKNNFFQNLDILNLKTQKIIMKNHIFQKLRKY
jgi:hypothetical protein